MRLLLSRLVRASAALTLTVAAVPLAAGVAAASQSGEDHTVTLCHRTNSENNPYVVITIDKAGVFQTGHDSHDEGGVYQSGDKARGVRWGDIIPAFDYYASPQDERSGALSHYAGLNNTAEGLAILDNGCEVPGAPGGQPQPTGSLSGDCTDDQSFVVAGTTDSDGSEAEFRLRVPGEAPIVVPSDGNFHETVTATSGTVVTLEYRLGDGGWTSTGATVTVTDCPPPPPTQTTPPSGSFTTDCTATGALVDIGALDRGTSTGGRFELVVNGTPQTVTSGQQDVVVPGQAALVLRYVASDATVTALQSGTAPAACPPPAPPQPERGLTVAKSVLPGGPATVGDTLTYTLTVAATGTADQAGVTVSDYIPGYRPGTTSGTTTYVVGSATCAGTGTCTASYDATAHQLTWGLGTMAAGAVRSVSFQVTIDRPAAASDGSIPAFEVVNVGVAGSERVSPTTSNQVVTPVMAVLGTSVSGQTPGSGTTTEAGPTTAVLGTKHGAARSGTSVLGTRSGMLPHTGVGRVGRLLLIGVLMLVLGSAMVAAPSALRRR